MKKKWLSSLVIFVIMQIAFILIDGTRFEPKLNDSGNIMSRYAHWITDTKLVTEWFAIYTYPYFNLVTFIFLVALMINIFTDVIHLKRRSSKRTK